VFTYRETALPADRQGQYVADALVNGAPVRMLVDTGATDVVVSASTAARLGLVPSGGRKRAIQTANGRSTASPVLLSHVSFGGLYVNDVEALILAPEAGEVNLLGESFLKRLISVEQRDGMLILKQ
jgi:aspartyl protease family protein